MTSNFVLQHSQLREHEQRIVELAAQLQQLNADAPPRTAKGHIVQEYFYRQRYIEEEVRAVANRIDKSFN